MSQHQDQPIRTSHEILFNHILLPDQLPNKEDADVDAVGSDLVGMVVAAVVDLRQLVYDRYYRELSLIIQSLWNFKRSNSNGVLNRQVLLDQFSKLERHEQLVLHVTQQNAAILVRREPGPSGDSVTFEAFETSASSEKVLEAESALLWAFPSISVSIPYSTFCTSNFRTELVKFLEQASKESVKRFAAATVKASSGAWESRDTVDPSLVTGMLMTLLEALGTRTSPTKLEKRVRDEVSWSDGAINPWRRNPVWLILRVAVQRHLQLLLGIEAGKVHYKFLRCWILQCFLGQIAQTFHPEQTMALKAKLCRRMAKLESERSTTPDQLKSIYNYFFDKLSTKVAETASYIDEHTTKLWSNYRSRIERKIAILPNRATSQDTRLGLPNSIEYLNNILNHHSQVSYRPVPNQYNAASHTVPKDGRKEFGGFADRYYDLIQYEDSMKQLNISYEQSNKPIEERCVKLSAHIVKYLEKAPGLYNGNTEAISTMILNIMELWVSIDSYTVSQFPLLANFHPAFTPEMLYVLQVTNFDDLERLRKIGEYLHLRVHNAQDKTTIFIDPCKGCFADVYVESSSDAPKFKALQAHIEAAAEIKRLRKEDEWAARSAEYEQLSQQILTTACQYSLTDDMPPIQIHEDKKCTKCFLERKARRLKITAHEHPLPVDPFQIKAILFELACPVGFFTYRDITWRILTTLALPNLHQAGEPRLLLHEYSELTQFKSQKTPTVTLGSSKKSFLQTHLSNVSMPAALEKVCIPNGLCFGYFDTAGRYWPSRAPLRPSFHHYFPLPIPDNSPFSSLKEDVDPVNPPTSYEVVASQSRCPSGVNVHEFLAYQGLLSGHNRRLPSILVELASSNLNFSSETTTSLIRYLVNQTGPDSFGKTLRVSHQVLTDGAFGVQLLDQIESRLKLISGNWREVHCMDMLIMLLSRVIDIWTATGTNNSQNLQRAISVLGNARQIIAQWLRSLRTEVDGARTTDSSRKFSEFALWAALLGRATFFAQSQRHGRLDSTQLTFFIECSIVLQHSLVSKPSALPKRLRSALIADLRIVYRLKDILEDAITAHPSGLPDSLGIAWPQEAEALYLEPEMLSGPHQWWVRMQIAPINNKRAQTVLLHLLEGHLLLDGKPLGQLPPEHRKNPILRLLFENKNLLTIPSRLPGMTYKLRGEENRHQIHIGFRDGVLIVRAEYNKAILEYVPTDVFTDKKGVEDLPASLIDGCYHWLDIKKETLYARQVRWKMKESDWAINIPQREARRRNVRLVDRFSPLFKQIAVIFSKFENERYLTVFQPPSRNLSVEMRRLELRWEVGPKGYLESEALQSHIDPDQDVGTWYGFRSKIVLRDNFNGRNRTVITPIGLPRYRTNGPHVEVEIKNNGVYGRYQINKVLGRLDCPPEPLLLYTKAVVHALTSFIIPDPLTGRTGTEEAIHCLRSGYCQPWNPLNIHHYPLLNILANLTPKREYYPIGLKVMEKVSWDQHLRSYAQDEDFFSVIKDIVDKSEQLLVFSKEPQPSLIIPCAQPELYRRAQQHRSLYKRNGSKISMQRSLDKLYLSRAQPSLHAGVSNVYETVHYLDSWTQRLPLPPDLAGILENWQNVGGFDIILDKILLSDKLGLDIPLFWGSLAKTCQSSDQTQKYTLMFLLSMIVYNSGVNMDAIRTLISFATNPALNQMKLPMGVTYNNFRRNPTVKAENLKLLIKPYCKTYKKSDLQSPTAVSFTLNYKVRRKLEAEEATFTAGIEKEVSRLIDHLLRQWPCLVPAITGYFNNEMIDLGQILPIVQPEWTRLYSNLQLSNHLVEVQQVLDLFHLPSPTPKPLEYSENGTGSGRRSDGLETRLCLHELFQAAGPSQSDSMLAELLRKKRALAPANSFTASLPQTFTVHPYHRCIQELDGIITNLAKTKSIVRERYSKDLRHSLDAFRRTTAISMAPRRIWLPSNIEPRIKETEGRIAKIFEMIRQCLEREGSHLTWLRRGALLPCMTPISLLESLRSIDKVAFGPNMRECLTVFGLLVTEMQQLLRIEFHRLKGDISRVSEEEANPGHQNWEPLCYPDWLLLEIDSNILIRRDQIDVAHATTTPASGENSVLQMNMGQGKTSCIMPMAAAFLADGKRLLRVVVPRALLLQTVQMIHARLGGLVGREVRHVPFSRQTPTNKETIKTFHDIHVKILKNCGLMVTLPEHSLSFMLSGLQRLSDDQLEDAKPMIRAQGWLNKFSRDILDESDFTLAVRTQLIYPSGTQKSFDGHPHRWKTVQVLLSLVESYLENLRNKHKRSIEVVRRQDRGFPFIYFLRKDAEETLVSWLVDDICSGRTSILPLADSPGRVQNCVKRFISSPKVSPDTITEIRRLFKDKISVVKTIYLLRGLFVHRILLLALKKRWNVQYGLHPTRDPVAVPYYAKGVPSEQAEWGHPDVAILFTCLSFYYHGLSMDQLGQSLRFVLQSDDPSSEYDRWAHSSETLPGPLREWNSINVDDEVQLADIWKHVRYNIVVIDHYLNNFVFPKHAKQFTTKLQASGWDIPLFSDDQAARSKYGKALTTGFSGTNDNKTMLPLTITQEDLPTLSHTNAEVLTYLLQPRNRQYILAADPQGRRWSERSLLKKLFAEKIHILIDAGAHILEMDNQELVSMWMEIDYETPAALYFDKSNKPIVLYRNGKQVPLLATPYAEDCTKCLVYLDESHTRGTDLKFPINARGALTLGPGQTKDHTVQAAMRLRQLGTTQSVVFFAPPEVHQSIVDTQNKSFYEPGIDSSDVITWLLHQTCIGIEQLQPLYFSQGADFCRRVQAASDNPDFLEDVSHLSSYLDTLRQQEQQTLKQMYEPKQNQKALSSITTPTPSISKFMDELKTRKRGFQDTGEAVHGSALQEVEQEREVAFEVESVREVQKPVHYTPFKFPGLHKDLITFIHTGRPLVGAAGYEPAFAALRRTCSLGEKYAVDHTATSNSLFVSIEFTKTVQMHSSRFNDNFQRNVNWILISPVHNIAIVIIPEEADLVIKLLRTSVRDSPIHLTTYAAPVTKKMVQFDSLQFFSMPTLPPNWQPTNELSVELGIFSGRLYFHYGASISLKEYLRLEDDELELTEDDGRYIFTRKPISFLQEWLILKRKGQDFLHTPMGYLCQGKSLLPTHPFFQDAGGVKEVEAAANIDESYIDEYNLIEPDTASNDDY
ncbi:hypothetical protein ABW19_dt0206271 [Dactylella cylindrospora]|nr:hypothetical protein ABW19_dt0206271 [Dactylella cylindrospora]